MGPVDYSRIEPFEICSIRPPTENYSLTFRLTRNCYWNRCRFCPAYKLGAKFSRRSLDEVKADIQRAKRIDDLLGEHDALSGMPERDDYAIASLMEKIEKAKRAEQTESPSSVDTESATSCYVPEELDPRLAWFLSWFKETPTIEDSVSHVLAWRQGGGKTCFLGDADSLILKPNFLAGVMENIGINFPSLNRFTVYGRTRTASRKKLSELRAFRESGLDRVHFGLESGCDEVLDMMNKGVTADEHIAGCLKVKEAGLSCSVYVMPGLGGADLSERHAADTASVLTRIAPDYIRLRSLVVFPQTPLELLCKKGDFIEAADEMVVREIRILIESIGCETVIVSDSAANLLRVNGKLPSDRSSMLSAVDSYLELSSREKLEFSLRSRLSSFFGQYGGLPNDVLQAISPMISDGRVDPSVASEQLLRDAISLIRDKLMP